MWEQMMKFSLPAGLGAVCLGVVQIRRMYKREESEGAVTAGFDQAAAPVMETRGACDDAFDAWMHCVIHGFFTFYCSCRRNSCRSRASTSYDTNFPC